MRVSLKIFYMSMLFLSSTTSMSAHESTQFGADVLIGDVYATVSSDKDSVILQMYIDNDGDEDLYLLEAQTSVARDSVIFGRVGHMSAVIMDSAVIPSGDITDFGSSHLRIELYELDKRLSEGDTFDVTLEFLRGSATIPVHVHEEIHRPISREQDAVDSQ